MDIIGRCALGAEPGHVEGSFKLDKIERPGRSGGSDDRPERPKRAPGGSLLTTVPRTNRSEERLLDTAAVCRHGLLDEAPLRIRAGHDDEEPSTTLDRPLDDVLHRIEAKVGGHRERIGTERPTIAQPRLAIGRHGRVDVTSLGIGDHEQACVPGGGHDRLERAEPSRAVPLEERDLRLDRRRHVGHRLDDGATESLDRGGVVVEPPPGQEDLRGIDADAQRARRRDPLHQTIPEPLPVLTHAPLLSDHRSSSPHGVPSTGASPAGPSTVPAARPARRSQLGLPRHQP